MSADAATFLALFIIVTAVITVLSRLSKGRLQEKEEELRKSAPWVLVQTEGISMARMEWFRDVGEVDQFIRAGVALTRAFRFGRPISG